MVATLAPMAREKKEETETVRLRKSIVRRIARIAAHKEQSVPDYLAAVLSDIIDRDESQMMEEMRLERGERKPKK